MDLSPQDTSGRSAVLCSPFAAHPMAASREIPALGCGGQAPRVAPPHPRNSQVPTERSRCPAEQSMAGPCGSPRRAVAVARLSHVRRPCAKSPHFATAGPRRAVATVGWRLARFGACEQCRGQSLKSWCSPCLKCPMNLAAREVVLAPVAQCMGTPQPDPGQRRRPSTRRRYPHSLWHPPVESGWTLAYSTGQEGCPLCSRPEDAMLQACRRPRPSHGIYLGLRGREAYTSPAKRCHSLSGPPRCGHCDTFARESTALSCARRPERELKKHSGSLRWLSNGCAET